MIEFEEHRPPTPGGVFTQFERGGATGPATANQQP
jgi:hypothetical protein